MNVNVFLSKPKFIRVSTAASLMFKPEIDRASLLDVCWQVHLEDIQKRIHTRPGDYDGANFEGGVFSTYIARGVVFVDRAIAPDYRRVTEIVTEQELQQIVKTLTDGNRITFTDDDPLRGE